MLDAIGFDNYRIFDKETILNLKPITILTGPNSSGKSSVIKAAKLLKQSAEVVKINNNVDSLNNSVLILKKLNGGACQVPYKLNFLPDEYAHFLRSYESIVNEKNFKDKSNDSLSIILPIKLGLLKESFYGRLTFGPGTNTGNKVERIGFTVLMKFGDKMIDVIHLHECSGDFFFQIRANFTIIKQLLEDDLLPFIRGLQNIIGNPSDMKQKGIDDFQIKNTIEGLFMLSERDIDRHLLDSDSSIEKILKEEKWLQYNIAKPILPFYQILIFKSEEQKKEFYSADWYADNYKLFEAAKEKHNHALGFDMTQILNTIQKQKVFSYFKKLEQKLFKIINEEGISFPFQQANEFDLSPGWDGIILDNTVFVNDEDHQLVTSKVTQNALLKYEPLKELFQLYQLCYKRKKLAFLEFDKSNSDVLNIFITRLAGKAVANFATSINHFEFFDPNRIEQALFYHSSNTPFAFTLLSDFNAPQLDEFDEPNDFIKSQLRLLLIADGYKINKDELGIFTIYLKKNNKYRPLAEFGYGITKIFFLLLAIDRKVYRTLFLEEPETNLHPDLQSKLANIIVEAQTTFRMQFIIETHSEYFIRKLQYIVATKEIEGDKILINYFNPAELREKEGIVKEIRIQKDGSLSQDFGPGFFDEALNWKFELMKLKNLN